MAASPVLADSSYYIRLMREGRDPLRGLVLAAGTRDLAVCGVVRCEVGRALRQPKVRQRLHSVWDAMINVPTDSRLWEEVEETLFELDRKGMVLPLADAIIACCARRIGAVVLTHDHHFGHFPGIHSTDRLDW
jgi:predicted nucleic acid-binding protein